MWGVFRKTAVEPWAGVLSVEEESSALRDTLQFALTTATPWDRWKYEWMKIPKRILFANDGILPWNGKKLELYFLFSGIGFSSNWY